MSDLDHGEAQPEPGAIGSTIAGRYEVRDVLGKGAQGTVLEAYDSRLGRLLAIKMVKISLTGDDADEEILRRFEVEARAAARLSHPGIVSVYDSGVGDGFAWIAMEIVIGRSVAEELASGSRPSTRESVRIVCELLSALEYAHNRGVVHCDVKPANMLLALDFDDDLGKVRLTDFGIAQIERGGHAAVDGATGTPLVMAPEQVMGGPIDHRVDLWAAGVILYQLLTGERPFAGRVPAIYANILQTHPLPPSQRSKDIPPAIDAVIARALAKDPDARYGSAEEMAVAVRAAVESGAAAPVPGDSAGNDPVRTPGRGRRDMCIAALAFFAGVAVSVAVWFAAR